jgi:uncharacterized protein involved in exopolysaccharide biosynthesis
VRQTEAKPELEVSGSKSFEELTAEDLASESHAKERQAQLLRLLWGRRRFFLKAAVVGMVLSTAIAFLLPKEYTASTQLMPPDSQSGSAMALMAGMMAKGSSGPGGSGLGDIAGNLLGLKTSGALFIGVLRSERSQYGLIERFDLKNVYHIRLMVDARKRLDANTAIIEDRKSGIITINVTDRSPNRAADLAAAYVEELNTLITMLSTSAAHREREFLDQRLTVVKRDLDEASDRFARFSSKNGTLDIQQEGKAMLEAAAGLEGQLIAAQAELEGLRQIYSDNNARVRALNARVAELRTQLDKLGGTQSAAGQRSGDPVGDMPYPSIRNLPLLGVTYGDYYRRFKIEETVYELLTQQSELAKVQEAKDTPSVKVLDPALVPERKSSPKRLLIMISGTLIAVILCVAFELGSARWRDIDPQDPRKAFVEEVAATVSAQAPWASPNGAGTQSRAQKIWSRLTRRPSDKSNVE